MNRGVKAGLVVVAAFGCNATTAEKVDSSESPVVTEHPMVPLRSVPIPQMQSSDIVDRLAAVRLGKALFWDMQAGGDGQQACATCHFSAGVDTRRLNTMHPGPNGEFESNGVTGPGEVAQAGNVLGDDRIGSQGVVSAKFEGIAADPAVAADTCTPTPQAPFDDERRVTARNTPSIVNSVFFRDTFWDGRAHHVFNGHDPFGTTANASGGSEIAITNGSLASQATGPAMDDVEMACSGRPFNGPNSLASKLLARTPLQLQSVSPTDSVLGELSASPSKGLRRTYREMIEDAFGSNLAASAETAFSRIWGQAIAAYESTLIADDTPLDRFLSGDTSALTARQKTGLEVFKRAGCIHCHAGGELSDATVSFADRNGLISEDGGDQGFHNIGVRPVSFKDAEDLGRAGTGPKGASHSVSKSEKDRGAFKTPSLRNVKLTAPYFHNGGKATLGQVVAFYARGGDFRNPSQRIKAITFFPGEGEALVDFLGDGLTDCRTEKERAPFDHPSIEIPNGPSIPAVGAAGTGDCP